MTNRHVAVDCALAECERCMDACISDEKDGKILFAITWAPNPNLFSSHDPVLQYEQVILRMKNKCLCHYCFIPELTLQGNVHIHGFYTVSDPIGYHRNFLPRLKRVGFVQIKQCFEPDKWLEYCMKTIPDISAIMNDAHVPVPYSESDTTDYVKVHNAKLAWRKCYLKPKVLKPKPITDWIVVGNLNVE